MTRWQRGEAEIERMLAGGEVEVLTGAAADGEPWLSKARRTLSTAAGAADTDPDSAPHAAGLVTQILTASGSCRGRDQLDATRRGP
jgi:hypothetical protein